MKDNANAMTVQKGLLLLAEPRIRQKYILYNWQEDIYMIIKMS